MAKIMITACAIALAVATQAASFDWKTSMSGKLYNGNSTDTYSGTAYLFSTSDFTQQAILSAWDSGTFSGDKAISSKSVKAGAIAGDTANPLNWGNAGDTLIAYVVVNDGDKIFISDSMQLMGDASSTKQFAFALKAGSTVAATEFETGSAKFSAQGWYKSTGGGVPEPTSGLLLVLGMAGLALRRRRA